MDARSMDDNEVGRRRLPTMWKKLRRCSDGDASVCVHAVVNGQGPDVQPERGNTLATRRCVVPLGRTRQGWGEQVPATHTDVRSLTSERHQTR